MYTPREQATSDPQLLDNFATQMDEVKSLWWKDVFNSNHKHWGYISYARDAAREAAYTFFVWNGHVYRVDSERETGILESDVL